MYGDVSARFEAQREEAPVLIIAGWTQWTIQTGHTKRSDPVLPGNNDRTQLPPQTLQLKLHHLHNDPH